VQFLQSSCLLVFDAGVRPTFQRFHIQRLKSCFQIVHDKINALFLFIIANNLLLKRLLLLLLLLFLLFLLFPLQLFLLFLLELLLSLPPLPPHTIRLLPPLELGPQFLETTRLLPRRVLVSVVRGDFETIVSRVEIVGDGFGFGWVRCGCGCCGEFWLSRGDWRGGFVVVL